MKFLSFGEIIFDVFGCDAVLGGAPLNVAVHLSRLGGDSFLVSSIGADDLGKKALEEIVSFGVNTKYIGLSAFDTGRADVILDSTGSARYEFNFPAAWDDIKLFPQEYSSILKDEWDGVVFGTLAQRSDITRETLKKLLSEIKANEILFDVNIRGAFFNKSYLELGLRYATILKLNQEELSLISSLLEIPEDSFAKRIFSSFNNIKGILLTKGGDGISYIDRNGEVSQKAKCTPVVDTVGAGDSVSGVFLYYFLKTNNVKLALEKASEVAGFVVSTKGALTPYSEELKEELDL